MSSAMSCQRPSRTAGPSRPYMSSLMYSLPVRRLKDILTRVVPDITLGPVEDLPSTQLARLYTLSMSDGRKLLLSFAPSLAVRLLRHEATMLSSEAILVSFLAGTDTSKDAKESLLKEELPQTSTFVLGLVPKLLKHSANNREMAYPYSIFESTSGAPLSTLSIYLTRPERRWVDKQVGSLARGLASLTSPSRTFGTVNRVLPDPFASSTAISLESKGSNLWSEAFNLLLEGILRDGEDMAVLLPYETIRSNYQRLSWRLDVITTPRLLVLDLGNDTNLMIERGYADSLDEDPHEGANLTGLRSWSQGVFGDPLLSNCFEDPSEGFLEGWRGGGEDIIEDPENAKIRLLVYKCFRAIVSIVAEYYRPQGDSSRRELEGRRKLTSALAELEKVDPVVGSGHLKRSRSRSLSNESEEESKRQKIKIERV